MKNKYFSIYFFSLMLLFSLSACRDDDMPSFEIGKGEADIAVEVKFEPMTAALENTRTPGNAIKEINTLAVIVYNSDKELVKVFNQGNGSNDLKDYDYKVDGNTEMPKDENGKPVGDQSERTTAKATFKLPSLPYGKYKIYAVANMGTISEEDAKNIDDLKKKSLDWNADNIASNNQMFGYFTAANDQNGGAEGFDAPTVIINKDMKSIHAWIKRVVSKVTVAFDPSGLKQRVWIYIHDVSIRDIPLNCLLGADNTPDSDDKLTNRYNTPLYRLPASGKLIYGKDGLLSAQDAAQDQNQDFKYDVDESVYTSWLTLSRGSGIKGSDHSETAEALYFFENMQGDFEGKGEKFNKQISSADIDGECITEPTQEGFKNNVPYGTFIEVTGYYVSDNPQNTTKGKIKYRFMLGKNDTYNFNAQRNHHYKLTLGFDGWANQPKWNIEYYEQDPGLYVPDKFYVSYLYNQKHMMPIKIVGDCTNLKMEIVENNWAPYDPQNSDEVPNQVEGSGQYAFQWNKTAWGASRNGIYGNNYQYRQQIIKETDNWDTNRPTNDTQFGFLALAVPVNEGLPPKTVVSDNFDAGNNAQKKLLEYYESNGNVQTWNTGSQRVRDFNQDELKYDGPENGTYFRGHNGWQVTKIDNDSKMLIVPIFTRNKTMIEDSGFSGNNVYESYMRKAVIRVTASFKNGQTIVKQVPVFQTRRIVNPKGVWHRYNDNNPFQVKLMTVDKIWDINSNEYFTPLNSEGEWKAFVEVKNKNFITLKPDGKSYLSPGITDTIYGDTDTPIEFSIIFNGGISIDESACAIVRVEYNGYNCIHKIMVRQGYMAPMAVNGNTKWSSFSLYSCDSEKAKTSGEVNDLEVELTTNPLALGTFFKRHNTKEGIRIINNNATFEYNNQKISGKGPFEPVNYYQFVLTDGSRKTWSKITSDLNGATTKWGRPTDFSSVWGTFTSIINNKVRTYRLPTYQDFKDLEECEFGVGVLYTDGTTATAITYDQAYGYQAPNNLENDPDTGKGARGVIVYNRDNANQIFFPVGKNGMGRRTQFAVPNTSFNGVLHYSDVYEVLTAATDNKNYFRPVPYNLPIAPGAIYWFNTINETGYVNSYGTLPSAGWDINYFNFDFNPYPDQYNQRLSDARPIKLIVTN